MKTCNRFSKFGFFHSWTKVDGSEELWTGEIWAARAYVLTMFCPETITVPVGCTVKYLRDFCQNDPMNVRDMKCGKSAAKFKVTKEKFQQNVFIVLPQLFHLKLKHNANSAAVCCCWESVLENWWKRHHLGIYVPIIHVPPAPRRPWG